MTCELGSTAIGIGKQLQNLAVAGAGAGARRRPPGLGAGRPGRPPHHHPGPAPARLHPGNRHGQLLHPRAHPGRAHRQRRARGHRARGGRVVGDPRPRRHLPPPQGCPLVGWQAGQGPGLRLRVAECGRPGHRLRVRIHPLHGEERRGGERRQAPALRARGSGRRRRRPGGRVPAALSLLPRAHRLQDPRPGPRGLLPGAPRALRGDAGGAALERPLRPDALGSRGLPGAREEPALLERWLESVWIGSRSRTSPPTRTPA